MFNPFIEKIETQDDDIRLIRRIFEGSREDFESLIFRHQAWIYNIALKMVLDPGDAEDVTQEILIKMVTKLSSYNPEKASFRTWLYRIVANHVINMKKRKYENLFTSFEDCAAAAENIPDESLNASPEHNIMIQELEIKCWTGMLLCLNRKQRLVFVLGEIFELTDRLGSEILEISRSNFRKILSRSRKRVYSYMEQACGLINEENPCHCSRKLKGFIGEGFVNPNHIQFYRENSLKIKEIISENIQSLRELSTPENVRRFREHPFYNPPDFEKWLGTILKTEPLKELFSATLH